MSTPFTFPGGDTDPDEVGTMLSELRDHMTADHIVRVSNKAELTEFLASFFSTQRATAQLLSSLALVLDRVPESREDIAKELHKLAMRMHRLIPDPEEEEGA